MLKGNAIIGIRMLPEDNPELIRCLRLQTSYGNVMQAMGCAALPAVHAHPGLPCEVDVVP